MGWMGVAKVARVAPANMHMHAAIIMMAGTDAGCILHNHITGEGKRTDQTIRIR